MAIDNFRKPIVHKPLLVKKSVPVAHPRTTSAALSSDRARQNMVTQLAKAGIRNSLVLDAIAHVPRHCYVDKAWEYAAYSDNALSIGYGQTISRPYIVAKMVELLFSQRSATVTHLGKVLEVGSGCGYQAHVLSLLAKEVYSIERIAGLHALSKRNVAPFRLSNLRLLWGDGFSGIPAQLAPQAAPFDTIIIAAAPNEVPLALKQQLTVGGCLIAPVAQGKTQRLELWQRENLQRWKKVIEEECVFVPMLPGLK